MNIVYTVDNNFVPQLAAGMCSIMENNRASEQIDFYVIGLGISDKSKQMLNNFAELYNRKITIIEMQEIKSYLDFEFDTSGWSDIVLARLLIGDILPDDVERVLYLDGDTIVRGNLDELWEIDMKHCVIGASIEPTVPKDRLKNLDMAETDFYVNAGVLLIDLAKWRKEDIGNKIIEFYKARGGKLFANDQDAINGALKGRILPISPKYNFCNIYNQYPYRYLKKLMGPAKYFSEKVFKEAVANPVIIHYLGEERPWRAGNTHKYRKDYKNYLDRTPWKDTKDEQGWKIYFLCWRIFNIFMKPFPAVRYNIINILIPVFLNHRKKKLVKNKQMAGN